LRSLNRGQSSHQVDEENPYWISFSDIMAGLLVIFVLAAVALILELTQKSEQWDEAIKEIAKAEEIRRDILREIEEELSLRGIPVSVIDNDTVLRIPEDVLSFDTRSFDIPSDQGAQDIALEIGEVLYSSISKDDRWEYLDTIFVEGHSDRIRYDNPDIKGNWGLSTFRAISVWEHWNKEMPEGARLEELNNHIGRKLFSVSGYAETRPVPCTNIDPSINDLIQCPEGILPEADSLRKNRRIDIRFTVRRPALEDYQAIGEALN
jgi:flagellar motor protein MotB